jgi:5'-nucleotidase
MPLALLSNDDSIGSAYLRALADALSAHFDVFVAAPLREQSWIGRAMSRRSPVKVTKAGGWACPAYAIDGTPTDCVNIALDHLLPVKPDVVVSGINIGYNAGVPFILCSGTLGAAIEGAMWGIRAVAVSMAVPMEHFRRMHADNTTAPDALLPNIAAAARHAAAFTRDLAAQPIEHYAVHNLNYPARMTDATAMIDTAPSHMLPQGLFVRAGDDGVFNFRFASGEALPDGEDCDRPTIESGLASHSLLDFAKLGRR